MKAWSCIIWVLIGSCNFLHFCAARPTTKGDHVTMSGEPTHFQVDDKAAELEINANAMGVKVNAKPASLQVVSKPGAPSVPVARPAVVVPQLPAPYLPAPFYPSPVILGHRRTTRRRHHFFNLDPSMENWNFKKNSVPRKKKSKQNKISKKYEIPSKKKDNPKKRQWIQQVPVVAQLVPYSQVPNVRVHPLVQQMAALSQGALQQPIPHPLPVQTYDSKPRLLYINSFDQRSPYISQIEMEENGQAKSLVNRGVFIPPFSENQHMYAPSSFTKFIPMFQQDLTSDNPTLIRAPLPGFNGYYDPFISRDFIPDLGAPGMPHIPLPTSRAFVPGEPTDGMLYHGYTPLGLWQTVSKRLTITRSPTEQSPSGTKPINVQDTEKPVRTNSPQIKDLSKNNKDRRSVKESRGNNEKTEYQHDKSNHDNRENGHVTKRQFILTHPFIPRTPHFVTYVPVVLSPQIEASPMQTVPTPVGQRRNLELSLPLKTSRTFVQSLPLPVRGPQMYQTNPSDPTIAAFYNPSVNPGIVANQWGTGAATAVQRSGVAMEAPKLSTPVSLAELAGIEGQPVVQNSHHFAMLYNNEQLPSQIQDQLLGGSLIQDRTRIPGLERRERKRFTTAHSNRMEELDREYPEDYKDERRLYNDEPPSGSQSEIAEDEGSYSEKILPDGRTMLQKDHIGFGPITVQANTAEAASRDQDDATDMYLDSDKRKQIPRPSQKKSYLDKRLGIPKPSNEQ